MAFTTRLEIAPILRGLNRIDRFNPALPHFRPGYEAPKSLFTDSLSRRLVHFGDTHGTPQYLPNSLPQLSFRGRRHPWRPGGNLSHGYSSRTPKVLVDSPLRSPPLRLPRLAVKISTPNVDVDGLENLKVTVTVTNVGDETVKLLNAPRGVLSTFPANTFRITGPAGFIPSFVGAMV